MFNWNWHGLKKGSFSEIEIKLEYLMSQWKDICILNRTGWSWTETKYEGTNEQWQESVLAEAALIGLIRKHSAVEEDKRVKKDGRKINDPVTMKK